MKKPTQSQTWVGLIMAVLTAATSYLGYEKYEVSKSAPDITVNVETEHAHRTTGNINSLINMAIKNHKQEDH